MVAKQVDCQETLELAVDNGDISMAKAAIKAGACVNHVGTWGYPIYRAVVRADQAMIKLLAKKGANLNSIYRDQLILLHPIVASRLDLLELLIELGADIEIRNQKGDTPLLAALWRGNYVDAARVLIEHAADIYAKDREGNYAIQYAVFFETSGILDLMVRKYGNKVKTAARRAGKDIALVNSARDGDYDGMGKALQQGANVNYVSPFGTFPLYHAAENGNIPMLQLLIKNGAEVSLGNSERQTALMCAALGGHRDAVDCLLDAGANLLEEVMPGEELSDGKDMDAVAFAREGPNRELYEYLRDLRSRLQQKQNSVKASRSPKSVVKDQRPSGTASKKSASTKKPGRK